MRQLLKLGSNSQQLSAYLQIPSADHQMCYWIQGASLTGVEQVHREHSQGMALGQEGVALAHRVMG